MAATSGTHATDLVDADCCLAALPFWSIDLSEMFDAETTRAVNESLAVLPLCGIDLSEIDDAETTTGPVNIDNQLQSELGQLPREVLDTIQSHCDDLTRFALKLSCRKFYDWDPDHVPDFRSHTCDHQCQEKCLKKGLDLHRMVERDRFTRDKRFFCSDCEELHPSSCFSKKQLAIEPQLRDCLNVKVVKIHPWFQFDYKELKMQMRHLPGRHHRLLEVSEYPGAFTIMENADQDLPDIAGDHWEFAYEPKHFVCSFDNMWSTYTWETDDYNSATGVAITYDWAILLDAMQLKDPSPLALFKEIRKRKIAFDICPHLRLSSWALLRFISRTCKKWDFSAESADDRIFWCYYCPTKIELEKHTACKVRVSYRTVFRLLVQGKSLYLRVWRELSDPCNSSITESEDKSWNAQVQCKSTKNTHDRHMRRKAKSFLKDMSADGYSVPRGFFDTFPTGEPVW